MTCMYSSVWESMAMWLLGQDCPCSIIPIAAVQWQRKPPFQRPHANYFCSDPEDLDVEKLNSIRLDAPKWRKGCLHSPRYLRSIRMQCAMALSYLNILWFGSLSFSDCSRAFRFLACVSRALYLHAKQHRSPLIWQIITQ